MQRRDLGYAGGGFVLVAGTALVVYSVAGLAHKADQADHWKAQALAPRPTATVTATATPAVAPSSSPSSSPGSGSPGFRAQSVAARSAAPSGPAAAPVTPRPPSSPRPSSTPRPTPKPTPTAAAGCSPALVTVTVPLGALSCNTVSVASVARVGGTGK